jgi:type VI secretion system protein ImpG
MDPRLLDLYDRELGHLRAMGGEFAKLSPNAAGRLNLGSLAVADPYVERLLEGFAFLAARVQLRLDAEFPRFTERLLEICYPGFLAPVPSMLIARFDPAMAEPGLASGACVERGTTLKCQVPLDREAAAARDGNDRSRHAEATCRFRTAHAVQLWPIEVAAVQYLSHVADLPLDAAVAQRARAGVRLRLRMHADSDLSLGALPLAALRLHLCDPERGETAFRLYERLLGHTLAVLVLPAQREDGWQASLGPDSLKDVGFEDDEAMLPVDLRGFQGYRLLQEYFAFAQRFMFVDVLGLDAAIGGRAVREVDLVFLFDQGDAALEGVLGGGNVALHCTPATNLFDHRCDPIQLSDATHDYHVVPDRTQAGAYEVCRVLEVTGFGAGNGNVRRFLPLYAAHHLEHDEHGAYYCMEREPRLLPHGERQRRPRSDYVGCEAYISLVDPSEAPYASDLRQLEVRALCSNRDLPLDMPRGHDKTDLMLDISVPVASIRVVAGPTKPSSRLNAATRAAADAPSRDAGPRNGDDAAGSGSRMRDTPMAWRFLDHLSLNHLSLSDSDSQQGAASLREMLALYAVTADGDAARQQVQGVRHVQARPVVRRLPAPGRITFGRVLEIEVEVDDLAFQGASAFLLGSVLARFFARYATLNSHTETVLRSPQRGEIMRWSPRCGSRATL